MSKDTQKMQELIAEILESSHTIGKSGMKLITVAAMLFDIEWDHVDKFALKWENIKVQGEIIPCPVVLLTMKNGESKAITSDEKEAVEVELDKL